MSKVENFDQLEEQKEALFNAIDDFKDSLNLDDLDLDKAKELVKPLLIAGVAAFVIYKLFSGIFGRKVSYQDDNAVLKNIKTKGDTKVSRFVKEQAVIVILALARKWIKKYLRANKLLDED
jgi:hypothetical protein